MLGVDDWKLWVLQHFDLVMLLSAVFFMLLNRLVTRRISGYDIIYRWLALFCVGFTGVYHAVLHGLYPEVAAAALGWAPSSLQYNIAVADLGFAVLAILSFNASYGFRSATVIGNTIWLWGFAWHFLFVENTGTWLWMDMILPLLLILCLLKIKRT